MPKLYTCLNIIMKTNDKVKYTGVRQFWFLDMMKNAEDNLDKESVYTIDTISLASSSTIITLKETGKLKYSASWFQSINA